MNLIHFANCYNEQTEVTITSANKQIRSLNFFTPIILIKYFFHYHQLINSEN